MNNTVNKTYRAALGVLLCASAGAPWSALVASGQVAQVTYHLNRAMDNGLKEQEAGEIRYGGI